MKKSTSSRRPPKVHVLPQRAARLHRLVVVLGSGPLPRGVILSELKIGLRTFYRELLLLKKRGIKVRFDRKHYRLVTPFEEAEGRLPVPDPELSFAEMVELSRCPCPAGARLAQLLADIITPPAPTRRGRKSAPRKR